MRVFVPYIPPYEKEGVEGFFCGLCDAHIKINQDNLAEPILERTGVVPIEGCPQCTEAFARMKIDKVIGEHLMEVQKEVED